MKTLKNTLENQDFPITYEPDAPSGTNLGNSLIEADPESFDALCVYNNPGGNPKIDPFVYGWKLREEYGKDIVVNVRVQDYSVPLFQSVLWGGHILGIRNVLLVTGDYHPSSPSMISITEGLSGINKYLNQGYLMPSLEKRADRYSNRFLEKNPEDSFDGETDYYTGSALIPHRSNETEIYRKKIQAGAEFFMTQITYSPKEIINFLEEVNPTKPILVGTSPITSMERLKFLKDNLNVKGLSKNVQKKLKNAKNTGEKSVEICTKMYKKLKDYANEHNYSLGAHIMSIGSPKLSEKIAKNI